MKEISEEFLKNVESDYLSRDIYTIARHSLTKNKISNLIIFLIIYLLTQSNI